MDINLLIQTYVVPYLPMVATVIATAISFFKLIKSSTDIFKKTDNTSKQIDEKLSELTTTLSKVLSENAELKQQNRELKQLITHVVEEDNAKE